ncbi:LPXTG cell wall anchor domain-containing protein [Glutamicibacter sp. NPDC127525]|uniref:LPXTG cell wall anchor domain-containing protein n=1 Tax=unclassified Glutamicibacter TaxID=2627139 RepID=UPI003631E1ED
MAIISSISLCFVMTIPGMAVAAETSVGEEVEAKQQGTEPENSESVLATGSAEETKAEADESSTADTGEEQPAAEAVDSAKTSAPEEEAAAEPESAPAPAPATQKPEKPKAVETTQPAPEAQPVESAAPKTENKPVDKASPELAQPKAEVSESEDSTGSSTAAREPITAAALESGAPRICEYNEGDGSVDTFMQKSDEMPAFANGNVHDGLYEGGVVHQRLEMTLPAGENELVIKYQVKQAGKWAYDYLLNETVDGANITGWTVDEGAGNDRVDTVFITLMVDGEEGDESSVTLYFDAHIASELDHGPGTGASSINGSPYHVLISSLNCKSIGQRDNQIQAGAVQAGSVTVIKDAVPADGTDFDFTLAEDRFGDSTAFNLDDSADSDTGASLPDRVTYTVAPSTVTITEVDLPAGWNLSSIACTGAAAIRSGSAITFELGDNDEVTCTFTNTKTTYDELTVHKDVQASYDRDYDWDLDKSLAQGQQATVKATATGVDVDYNVVATASEAQDSNFQLSGTITVMNPNDTAMSGITLADQLDGANCVISAGGSPIANPVTIQPGENSFTYECDLPEGTSASSAGTNTVSATWDPEAYYGTDGQASASAGYDFASVSPTVTDEEVTVTDSEIDLSGIAGGNTVTAGESPKSFAYTIEWDGVLGECTDYQNIASLAADDGETPTDNATVEICIGQDLAIEKLVVSSFNRSYDWSIAKDAVGEQPFTADPETGEFTAQYSVTVTPESYSDSDWAMSGTITVSNPNDWQAIDVTVTDQVDVGGDATCQVVGIAGEPDTMDADPAAPGFQATLDASQTLTFSYSCTFGSQPNYEGSNTAEVTWSSSAASTASGSATEVVPVDAGDWTQTPLNQTVTVTDPLHEFDPAWTINYSDGPQTRTYEYTWTVDEAGTCQSFMNTATITGSNQLVKSDDAQVEACRQAGLTVTKDVTASYDRTYLWSIDKQLAEGQRPNAVVEEDGTATVHYTVLVDNTGYEDSGQQLSGSITVANPNEFEDLEVTISDENTLSAACTIVAEDSNPGMEGMQQVVPRIGSITVDYNCDASAVAEGDYTGNTNTAVVTWGDGMEAESQPVPIDFTLDESTDESVGVWDDQADPSGDPVLLGTVHYADAPQSFSYEITYEVPRDECLVFTNTAWVDLAGEDIEDSQDVGICDQKNLVITKDVDASYARDYDWSLHKQVDRSEFTVAGNGTVTAHYTVVATAGEAQDSAKQVSGTITISNPNTQVGDLAATVTDVLSIPSASCTIEGTDADETAGGFQLVLGDGESTTLGYNCQVPADTDITAQYTNTATVAWGQERQAETDVDFGFEQALLTDGEVAITDDQTVEGQEVVLGTAMAGESPKAFEYDLELQGVAGTCTEYTNTAVLDEATGEGEENTASASTTVCAGADLDIAKNVVTSFDRSYLWSLDKELLSGQPLAANPSTGEATANYRITVTPEGHEDGNWAMSGEITLANPNDWQDAPVTVQDFADVGGDVACTITGVQGEAVADMSAEQAGFQTVIPAGAQWVMAYSCTFASQPDYEGSNTATVDWDAQALSTANSQDSDTVGISEQDWNQTPLNDTVTITDSAHEFDPAWTVDVADGPQSRDYSVTWTVDQAGTCQVFENVATLTGDNGFTATDNALAEACREAALEISKTVEAAYDRTYQWQIDKSLAEGQDQEITTNGAASEPVDYVVKVENTGYEDSGWVLEGQITITNPNQYTGIDATIQDVVDLDAVTCTTSESLVGIPANGTITVGYSCDVSAGVDPGSYSGGTNTATVSWGDDRASSTQVPIEFAIDSRIDRQVEIWDDQSNPQKPVLMRTVDIDDSPVLIEYQLEHDAPAGECMSYTNTAWVDIQAGEDPRDEATVQLCGLLDLMIAKDAEASFDRTYLWDLEKKVDRTEAVVAEDGTADFSYTVSAIPDGSEDSGHEVNGMIILVNPNHFESASTVATITDEISIEGVTCTIDAEDADPQTGGLQVAVPVGSDGTGATVQLPYSCSGTPGQLHGSNTVTATWGEGSVATSTAPVDYLLDAETDQQVTVIDDKTNPESPVVLGEAIWNAEGTPVDFDYTLRHQAQAGTCTEFTNTAVIQQTGADDSTTVTLCGQKALGLQKTAQGLVDLDYEWEVEKRIDQSKLTANGDGTFTAHYWVQARNTAAVEQNLRLAGEVMVQNPNDFGSITATLEDRIDTAGTSCRIDLEDADEAAAGLQVVLDAGENLGARYECDLASWLTTDAFEGAVNTVIATFDDREVRAEAPIGFTIDAVTDESVRVTDDMMDPGAEPKVLGEVHVPQAPMQFEYEQVLEPEAGTCTVYTNTAAVHESTDGNGKDESSVDLQLCIEQGLMIAKSADAQYVRDYDWSTRKDAKETKFEVDPDGQATAKYTVQAMLEDYEDQDFTVTGEITVANPNDFKDTQVLLEDKLSIDGATCSIEGLAEGKLELAAGETRTVKYSCTFETPVAEADYTGHENTVNASWTDVEGTTRTVSAKAPLEFEAATATDEMVTVFDDYTNPGQPRELGTVKAEEQSKKFTYELVLDGVAGTCQTMTNTASIPEKSGEDGNNSDSADVEVCSEAPQAAPPAPPVPPAPPAPPAPAAPPAPPAPLAATGLDQGSLWLAGAAGMVIIAGALILLRYRRRNP